MRGFSRGIVGRVWPQNVPNINDLGGPGGAFSVQIGVCRLPEVLKNVQIRPSIPRCLQGAMPNEINAEQTVFLFVVCIYLLFQLLLLFLDLCIVSFCCAFFAQYCLYVKGSTS